MAVPTTSRTRTRVCVGAGGLEISGECTGKFQRLHEASITGGVT